MDLGLAADSQVEGMPRNDRTTNRADASTGVSISQRAEGLQEAQMILFLSNDRFDGDCIGQLTGENAIEAYGLSFHLDGHIEEIGHTPAGDQPSDCMPVGKDGFLSDSPRLGKEAVMEMDRLPLARQLRANPSEDPEMA